MSDPSKLIEIYHGTLSSRTGINELGTNYGLEQCAPNMQRQVIPRRKNLLLCFDAFGTLFTPRRPVHEQYGEVARKHGLSGFKDNEIEAAFHKAFKQESAARPNYGRAVGMKAPQWWSNIITNTLKEVLPQQSDLPDGIVTELVNRFHSSEGYRMYDDVQPFFASLRDRKAHLGPQTGPAPPPSSTDPSLAAKWPFDHTIVGVITNSDDRTPNILSSLGLNVGPRRVGKRSGAIAKSDLTEDVSFVVLSYDVGYEKPKHQIFDAAIWLLEECLAAEAQAGRMMRSSDFERVYVGDEPAKDIIGAQDAGWDAVFLDREGTLDGLKEHPAVLTKVQKEKGERQVVAINDLRNLGLVFEDRED